MSGAAMGFLSGLGRGVASVADTMIKSNEEQKLTELEAQIQAERDKRIEEANIARDGRQEQYKIAGEKRGLENDKIGLQNTIDVNTDPSNIERVGKATVAKQRYEDEYKDSRLEADVRRARALDGATDHTDYAGRSLDHQLKSMEIAEYSKPGRMSKTEKEAIDYYREDNKQIWKRVKDLQDMANEADEETAKGYRQKADELMTQFNTNEQKINGLRNGETTIHETFDPLAEDAQTIFELRRQGVEDIPETAKERKALLEQLKNGKKPSSNTADKPVEEKPKDNKPGFLVETIQKVKDTASDIVKPQEANKDLMDKARSILLNGPKALGEMPSDPEEAYNYKRLTQAINYTLKSDMSEEQKLDDIYRKLSGR